MASLSSSVPSISHDFHLLLSSADQMHRARSYFLPPPSNAYIPDMCAHSFYNVQYDSTVVSTNSLAYGTRRLHATFTTIPTLH